MNWQIIPEFPISVTFIVNFAMFYLDRMNIEAAEPRCLLIGRGCSVIGRHKLTNSSLKPATSNIITTTITLEYNLMSLKSCLYFNHWLFIILIIKIAKEIGPICYSSFLSQAEICRQ